MKNLAIFIIGVIFGFLATMLVITYCVPQENETTQPVEVTNDTENTSVTHEDSIASIQDVLRFREHVRELNKADSIFMTIPDVILIDILYNHGTELSNYDIAQLYINYPETYNIVSSGARSQRYLDSIKKQREPDILPKPAPTDSI